MLTRRWSTCHYYMWLVGAQKTAHLPWKTVWQFLRRVKQMLNDMTQRPRLCAQTSNGSSNLLALDKGARLKRQHAVKGPFIWYSGRGQTTELGDEFMAARGNGLKGKVIQRTTVQCFLEGNQNCSLSWVVMTMHTCQISENSSLES